MDKVKKEDSITIELSKDELKMVVTGLAELKFKIVASLMTKLTGYFKEEK